MKINSKNDVSVSHEPYQYNYSASSAEEVDDILNVVNTENEEEEYKDFSFPEMSDIELRLEEANCYKALLLNPLFGDGAGPIARRVENKVREYIRQELKTLLGLEQPKPVVKHQFDEDEEKILKMLASKVLNKTPPPPEKKELVVNQAQIEPPKAVAAVKKVDSKPKVLPAKLPQPVKKGRPFKEKVVSEDEVPEIQGPTEEKEIVIRGKLVKVKVPTTNQAQVRPGPSGKQPLPPLTDMQAVAHVQGLVSTSAPKTGLVGLAVAHAVKNGIEE